MGAKAMVIVMTRTQDSHGPKRSWRVESEEIHDNDDDDGPAVSRMPDDEASRKLPKRAFPEDQASNSPHSSRRPKSKICLTKKLQNKKGTRIGCFQGVNALFISGGVSLKRLQIWRERMTSFGGLVAESCGTVKEPITHVFAFDNKFLEKEPAVNESKYCKKSVFLKYDWIEDSLKEGKLLPCGLYCLEDTWKTSSYCNNVALSNKCLDTSLEEQKSVDVKRLGENLNATDEVVCTNKHVAGIQSMDPETQILDTNSEDDCEHGEETGEPSLPNKHLTSILREMWDMYESVLGDEWRSLTYRKAVIQLEKLQFEISNPNDLKNIRGIGNSMAEKMKEILATGRLQKLDSLKADPKVQILQRLASVWGIGPKLAQKLYQAGHRTVEDLVKESSLSHTARLGVFYHNDLVLRIPRSEVEEAEKYVQVVAQAISPGILARVVGSYRRGKLTCGDIDVLVTHPDGYSHAGFLVQLVEKLKGTGFIPDGLHCSDHISEGTKKVDSFMGICRIPAYEHYRRIDIKVYPKESYAFALVYFTGNDILNRKIRYAAQRKGYKLNDQGLFLRIGGKKGISSTSSIHCETEEEVFNIVGFPYYEPYDRNL